MKSILRKVLPRVYSTLYGWKEAVRLGYHDIGRDRKKKAARYQLDVEKVGKPLTDVFWKAWESQANGRSGAVTGDLLTTDTSTVNIKGYPHPFHFRQNGSDLSMMCQIFYHREYEAVQSLGEVCTIIDCGANIGCSIVYLLSLFPKAKIVAFEPDPANFKVLTRNVSGYGDQVLLLNKAVWSSSCGLKIVMPDDGMSCSISVREVASGETPDVEALSVGDAMDLLGVDKVDLVKMDIEGAEYQVFSGMDGTKLLSRMSNLVIEPHGIQCEELLVDVVGSRCDNMSRSGEFLLFKGLRQE